MSLNRITPPVSVRTTRVIPGIWDLLAVVLVVGIVILLARGSQGVLAPLQTLDSDPVKLDPANLPGYAGRTALRMLAALALSLVFTFTYATLAAKSRRAEMALLPILDILQSVPILGFISVTVVWFMSLAPGHVLGVELAAIFAIFTSQAWNMAFSFYQSLRTVPEDLVEASRNLQMSGWMRFWRLEVSFAMPALVWNMMMSMSGGWFFVVASEAISVGETTITLPGVGSYIALAVKEKNLAAVGWAILTMLIVILIYDQLLFRPLVAWAGRFRYEQEAGVREPQSWVLTILRRSASLGALRAATANLFRFSKPRPIEANSRRSKWKKTERAWTHWSWLAVLLGTIAIVAWQVIDFVWGKLSGADILDVALRGAATFLRVIVLIAIASLAWVPIAVWIGLRPRWAQIAQPLAQFLAAFPANVVFPLAVSAIVVLQLDPNIWLSPLMVLGTQWYILFNVIAGASTIPSELRDVSANLQLRGWLWWRKVVLPAVFPYYVTGAITASGGSWNASIVAELANWGDTQLTAYGLGSYIADATAKANYPRIVLGIVVMSAFVVLLNRLFWRRLYIYAEQRLRLG